MKSKPTIYMLGTTHFDPVWMWTWDEAMASIRSTFRSALDRMREDPGFIYSFSCPPVFEWVRRVDPDLFAEIKQRVREGRWDLVEGWWVQPDCNLASGESYVRQGIFGQRYLQRHFGKTAVAAFNTDSFGHNIMLPQILRKSGMRAYVFGRPSQGHQTLPGPLFVWRSPDGSDVLAFRAGSEGANSYPLDVKDSISKLGPRMNAFSHDMLMLYGVSNHGGAPTREAIAAINEFREPSGRDFEVCFGSIERFFKQQDPAKLPVVSEELQTVDFGVYVNHTEIKNNNRRAEYALFNAESLSVLAASEYPASELHQAWEDVLFNQFHDIIGGASVAPVYRDARNLHGRALQNANEIIHYTLQSVTRNIDTQCDGFPLVVYNPHPFALETGVEGELQWAWEFPWYDGDLTVTGPDGRVIPCQIIQELSALPRFRSRFVFHDRLPPMGYKTYAVKQTTPPIGPLPFLEASESVLENDRYRIAIDQQSGAIASLEDKQLGKTVLHQAALPRILEDRGDTWAFNIDRYGPQCAPFELQSVRLIENGPVRSVLRTKARCLDSIFEQDIILYGDSDVVEGRFRVHWREQRKVLKLCFNTAIPTPLVTSAVPCGSIVRPADGREMPAGEWLHLGSKDWGIALINDSIFAYDVVGGTAALTLLRSPIFGHHGHPMQRNQIDETKDYRHLEQGCREGRWQLFAHAGDWRDVRLPERAAAFNNTPLTVAEANHGGDRPRQNSFLRIASNSVMLMALKRSEDSDNLVLRLYEYAGRHDSAVITLQPFNSSLKVAMKPHEIKTLLLEKGKKYRALETDMLESPLNE